MKSRIVRGIILLSAVAIVIAGGTGEAPAQTRARAKTRPAPAKAAPAQPVALKFAYQHGYRGGYDDGFTKGKSDYNENQPLDFESSDAFQRADRTYNENMGTRAEYQEGYRIGFEIGYKDGYYGRPYTNAMPANLGRIAIARANAAGGGAGTPPAIAPVSPGEQSRPRAGDEPAMPADERRGGTRERQTQGRQAPLVIPDGTQMKIRLTTQINTRTNREGDRFTATVVDPADYSEAAIEGHIAKLRKSGKASGKTELALAFDSITLKDGRSGRLAAQIERVYQSETVKEVDEEGNVQTSSRTKDTAVRSAGGAALGAIIGGIAGGGKGAAIGAAVGAGAGLGSVFIDGGKELILDPGTEILIRTAGPAR